MLKPSDQRDECARVAVVIVTYGDRWQYLQRVLDRVENDSTVSRVVIVDNASSCDLQFMCSAAGYGKTTIFRNENNLGSAGGFSLGITLACEGASRFILLLDDDNVPEEGAIEGLAATCDDLSEKLQSAKVVVYGFRECLHGGGRIPVRLPFMHNKDFLCFNLFNVFQRYLRLLEYRSVGPGGTAFASIFGGIAYSGMMFSPALIADIGLPDPRFVLYFDDFEYTKRMLRGGYTLWLDSAHRVNDVIDNYSASTYRTPLFGFLKADSDSKIYYNIRNRVYLDLVFDKKMSVPYMVNVFVFLSSFYLLCALFWRFKRLKTVHDAYKDGKNGRLGFNSKYPI